MEICSYLSNVFIIAANDSIWVAKTRRLSAYANAKSSRSVMCEYVWQSHLILEFANRTALLIKLGNYFSYLGLCYEVIYIFLLIYAWFQQFHLSFRFSECIDSIIPIYPILSYLSISAMSLLSHQWHLAPISGTLWRISSIQHTEFKHI